MLVVEAAVLALVWLVSLTSSIVCGVCDFRYCVHRFGEHEPGIVARHGTPWRVATLGTRRAQVHGMQTTVFIIRTSTPEGLHRALAGLWCQWNGQKGTDKQAARVMRQLNTEVLTRMLAERGIRIEGGAL